MRINPCMRALGLALLVVFSISSALAADGGQSLQPASQSANTSATTPPTATDVNKPKPTNRQLTPPPGKRRGITNEMRWAASIRSGDRKAHSKGRVNLTGNQSEVKQ